MSIRVAIIGVTGYTGGELIRYLLQHPKAKIQHCTSESAAGQPIHLIHKELSGKWDFVLEKRDVSKIARDVELAFLCLPHGESARIAKQFSEKNVKVIDLSADLRLKSPVLYKQWYQRQHPAPQLLNQAVYGLSELHRQEISRANLIANPGCYATATILTALPLLRKNLIQPGTLIIDAKSGISGAGKKIEARYLFCETNENFLAYSVAHHRHQPEIEQELKTRITFVPHLLPVNRGILLTAYAELKKTMSSKALWEEVAEFYKKEPFVVVLPEGTFPELKAVQYSNFCQIGVRVDLKTKRAILLTAIDNLGKGAAGQAVQNMNLMFGLEETLGLK